MKEKPGKISERETPTLLMMMKIKRAVVMKKISFYLLLAITATASVVSCNKKEIVDPREGLHQVNFTVSGKIDPSLTRTYIEESGDTYLAHWSDESSEHIGLIFDDVVKDMTSTSFDALDITNDIATFYGSAEITLGSHAIHPFYPASAFNKTYETGKIGLNLNRAQYPVADSFDPAADIMIGGDQDIVVDDADEVMVENVVFTRPMAVLRLHLVAKNEQAKAYGESVTSVEMDAVGQNPAVTLTGSLSYTPDSDVFSWNTSNSSVKAVFDSEHNNAGVVTIDTDPENNSVYLVVNPATISSGTIQFTIETNVHSGINAITRTVTVPEGGMEFLAGKVNDISLTVRDKDVPDVVTDNRILVEGFDNVSTNKTQPTASQTGVFGTGVTSSLEYTYSNDNVNVRFNNNGQASDNPYLYINAANQYFTMSNIAVTNQTWIDFTAKVKNTGTLTVNYKESSASTWSVAGTISSGSSFTESTVTFGVANTAKSIDIQLVGSAALIVDDIVLAAGTAPEHNLAVDETTKTLGGNQGSTVTIAITSNYAWTASISEGSTGFSIDPNNGGPDGSIVVTALSNGSTTEVQLGKVTISDGEDNVEVTIRQQPYTSGGDQYVKVTSIDDVTAGTYVIVNDGYYLPNAASTSASPVKSDATKVTVSDNTLINVTEAMTWAFSGNTSAMTIKSTIEGDYYLVVSGNGNSNLRVNTTTGKTWTISAYSGTEGAFSLKDNANSRFCATYSSGSDWRSYNSYNASNYGDGGRIYLYKKATTGPTAYQVKLGTIANGSVSRSVESAAEGASVTLTATANANYTFSSWDISGITLTDAQKTTNPLTISMPANDITVGASFAYAGQGTLITINFAEADQRPDGFPTENTGEINETTYTIAGYEFTFKATYACYWPHADLNDQKYLLIGKSKSYILFPAIEGQKLTNVKFTTGANASANVIADIYSADGETAIYGNTDKLAKGATYDWPLTGTSNNTSYQFRITNAYNAQLTSLDLTYE